MDMGVLAEKDIEVGILAEKNMEVRFWLRRL